MESIPINKALYQLSIRLASIDTSTTRTGGTTPSSTLPPSTSGAANLAVSLQRLNLQNRQQISTNSITSSISPINQPYATNGGNHYNRNNLQRSTLPNNKNVQHNSYSESSKGTISTILNFPSIIFNYFLAHKFETLFIGFFVLMVISVIFGSRS